MTAVSEASAREVGAPVSRRSRRLERYAVALALAAGAVFYTWTRSDMWLDEALTVNIARLPLGELREALERDGAPPLYYVLLHGWTGAFGAGDLAARSLSSVLGAAAVVATWFAARRHLGTRGAWVAVVLTAANPFAIRYATEARMYMLVVLLVALGIVAVARAVEQPSGGRLAAVAVVAAALVYTQYWAFYVVGVTGLALLGARRWRVAAAVAVGTATFLGWLPTFLFQRAHTGTPWGDPVLPGLPIGETFLGFAGGEEQEGWLLLLVLLPLVVLGAFGRALDERHVVLDVRTVPETRALAGVGAATLVVGTSLSYLAGQAFEPRYGAIVFPFFVLVAARGVTTLTDRRVQLAVLAVVVALGFVGGLRNVTEQRTQAGQVGAALRADARSGDLVVYCPDQLGPAVARLAPDGLEQVTYPELSGPRFVDWVDYEERLAAADPVAFADEVLSRAEGRDLWYVSGPGYPTHAGACEAVAARLSDARTPIGHVAPDEDFFEKPGLVQYPPPQP